MIKSQLVTLITVIVFCWFGQAQVNPIESLKWKNRILLLLADYEEDTVLNGQLTALGKLDSEFEKRKIIVVDVRKDRYRIRFGPGMEQPSLWKADQSLFRTYGSEQGGFQIVLIGLDGGIKLKQAYVLGRDELFERIDAMPMRRAEIRNKY